MDEDQGLGEDLLNTIPIDDSQTLYHTPPPPAPLSSPALPPPPNRPIQQRFTSAVRPASGSSSPASTRTATPTRPRGNPGSSIANYFRTLPAANLVRDAAPRGHVSVQPSPSEPLSAPLPTHPRQVSSSVPPSRSPAQSRSLTIAGPSSGSREQRRSLAGEATDYAGDSDASSDAGYDAGYDVGYASSDDADDGASDDEEGEAGLAANGHGPSPPHPLPSPSGAYPPLVAQGSEDLLAPNDSEQSDDGDEAGSDGDADADADTHAHAHAHARPRGAESPIDVSPASTEGEVVDPDVTFVVQKLFEQFVLGHHGCTDDEHAAALSSHLADEEVQHCGLTEVFNDPTFPSVLALGQIITPAQLTRHVQPTPAQWAAMYCGVPADGTRERPVSVCLHREETQPVGPDVSFDIDSFVGHARSLAVARKGLFFQPVPLTRQNITHDLHLDTERFDSTANPALPERAHLVMLREVAHCLLGRVEGAHDVSLFVFFPHMHFESEKFIALRQDQLTTWLDVIYLPAIQRHYRAHYTQHLPASFANALHDSRAHQVEARQVRTSSYRAQQSIGYHLQPEVLHAVWVDVLDTIAHTPGLGEFREPELFFTSKGTKLQFKTNDARPSLRHAMEHFQEYLGDILDLDFVRPDRLYVDLGKEICAPVSTVRAMPYAADEEAHVYLWRRCCQEQYMKWMYDGDPPRADTDGQLYYTQNMLADAGSLTSVTPRKSAHHRGGLLYSQLYASVKEIVDATKCFPFTNDGMEELALDPQICASARSVTGGRRRDAAVVEGGYLQSKKRASKALQDARRKSFGIREEHRVRWDVFQRLRERLATLDPAALPPALPAAPSYVWSVRTSVYLDFLWRSADKFATGFEVVYARSRAELVTWEKTKIMLMFLRCLRYVLGGHLIRRESALWWGQRARATGDGKVWYGMGFSNTLPAYRYCWLEPRVNWAQLQFETAWTDDMLFGNGMLRGQFLRRGGELDQMFNISRRIDLAVQWYGEYSEHADVQDRMISWIVHLCLEQFRLDIFAPLTHEIAPEHVEEVKRGRVGLSRDYIDQVMLKGCYLMSGNKTDFKSPVQLRAFLLGQNDGKTRDHWERKPFRTHYYRSRKALLSKSPAALATFQRRYERWLFQYHWVLPYPCSNTFHQTSKAEPRKNKPSSRVWYSIRPVADSKPERWEWARAEWQAGVPAALPDYLSWLKEEWEDWIRVEVSRSARRAAIEAPVAASTNMPATPRTDMPATL